MLLPVSAMIATAKKKKVLVVVPLFFGYIPVLLVPETGINAGMNTGVQYQTSLV
jgi:hypothetical protein